MLQGDRAFGRRNDLRLMSHRPAAWRTMLLTLDVVGYGVWARVGGKLVAYHAVPRGRRVPELVVSRSGRTRDCFVDVLFPGVPMGACASPP